MTTFVAGIFGTSNIALLVLCAAVLYSIYRFFAIPTRVRDWLHERRLQKEEARRKRLENDALEERINNDAVKKLWE